MALRVLIVDDSRDDAELTEHALRMAGLDVECRSACSEEGLARALARFAPQLVVCGLNLPGWSGREALAAVRARVPGARCVFVTGAVREGEDVSGAEAVVLKDDLGPLLALARALGGALPVHGHAGG